MRLKIAMRETEHHPRPHQPLGVMDLNTGGDEDSDMIGRKEGTVRFLFGPPWVVGQSI